MTGVYDKKVSPNKHLVQDIVYEKAAKFLRGNTEALILLGRYPRTAILRAIKFVTDKAHKLYGYDRDDVAISKAYNIGCNEGLKNFVITQDTVANAPCVRFQDIDFCGPFVTNRKNVDHQMAHCNNGVLNLDENDPANILMNRLCEMRKIKGAKVMTSTVMAARASYGKGFTFVALDSILNEIGYSLVDIDGVTNGYGVGTRISTTGSRSSNGHVHHAYCHKVNIRKIKTKAPKTCVVDVYTYMDTMPMFVFSIMFE